MLYEKLARAEGFLLLGMHFDAWKELDTLVLFDRLEPLALELKLRVLSDLVGFEQGQSIPWELASTEADCGRCLGSIARVQVAHARALVAAGEVESAQSAIEDAFKIFPAIGLEVMGEDVLQANFVSLPESTSL